MWETWVICVKRREKLSEWLIDEAVIQNWAKGVGFRVGYFEIGKDCWQMFVTIGIVMI